MADIVSMAGAIFTCAALLASDLVRGIGEKRPNISPKEIGLVGEEYGVSGQCVVLWNRKP